MFAEHKLWRSWRSDADQYAMWAVAPLKKKKK
jgi:hypothetical protein